jgi:hypothetical protein
MEGKTLSQWLDILIAHYDLPEVLDCLRQRTSVDPKLQQLTLKLEEAVSLATEGEAKS